MQIGLFRPERAKPSNRKNSRVFKALVLVVLMSASATVAQGNWTSATTVPGADQITPFASEKGAPAAAIDASQPQRSTDDAATSLLSAAVPTDHPSGYRVAPMHKKYILPDMRAQPLTVRGKFVIGLQDVYSPMNFGGIFVAAGYRQLRNGQPNYGTDRGAFGERLGAAGIRDSAQGFLTDAVFASLLHQDPRYYLEGSQHGVVIARSMLRRVP